ncbi:hypothetical protein ACFLY9_02315 [Patescibacteria group bacterium]
MLKKYILNFWIWWYGVRLASMARSAYSFWSLALANLNVLPMLSNIFVPMYQDQSWSGRFMSFFLRLGWIIFGSILQILITIPLIFVVLFWLALPVLCVVQVLRFFI